MSVKESFQQAQAEYENVVFVFNFDENGYEFNDVDEALEYAKEEKLHDVMWVNNRNNQIYGGMYFN